MPLTQQSQDQQLLDKLKPSRIILPVLIGLGVVGFMFWRSYQPGDLAPLRNAKEQWLVITFLVLIARDLGYIYRIREISERVLSWRQSLDVIMIWEFSSCVLPSAAGGTSVAPFILNKEGITLGKSLAYVMVTALLDNIYYVIAVPLVVLWAGEGLFPEELNGAFAASIRVAFVVSYITVTLYAAAMIYALFVNPRAMRRFLVRMFSFRLLRRWRPSAYKHGNEMVAASAQLRGNKAGYWVRTAIATAFVWTARYLVIGCIIAAFIPINFGEFWVIFSRNMIYKVVLLVAITPGGAGIAEGAFPIFFGRFIGTPTMTNFVILFYRITTYYLYLVLGAIFLPRWVARVFGRRAATTE